VYSDCLPSVLDGPGSYAGCDLSAGEEGPAMGGDCVCCVFILLFAEASTVYCRMVVGNPMELELLDCESYEFYNLGVDHASKCDLQIQLLKKVANHSESMHQ
jgi:hypothetical protein